MASYAIYLFRLNDDFSAPNAQRSMSRRILAQSPPVPYWSHAAMANGIGGRPSWTWDQNVSKRICPSVSIGRDV